MYKLQTDTGTFNFSKLENLKNFVSDRLSGFFPNLVYVKVDEDTQIIYLDNKRNITVGKVKFDLYSTLPKLSFHQDISQMYAAPTRPIYCKTSVILKNSLCISLEGVPIKSYNWIPEKISRFNVNVDKLEPNYSYRYYVVNGKDRLDYKSLEAADVVFEDKTVNGVGEVFIIKDRCDLFSVKKFVVSA